MFHFRLLFLQLGLHPRQRTQSFLHQQRCLQLQLWVQEKWQLLLLHVSSTQWDLLLGQQKSRGYLYIGTKNLLSHYRWVRAKSPDSDSDYWMTPLQPCSLCSKSSIKTIMLRLHGIVPACLAIGHGQPDLGETFGKIPSQLTFRRALPCESPRMAKCNSE